MGGGRRFPVPKFVWSSFGGWWPENKYAPFNFALVFTANFTIAYYAYQWAEKKTVIFFSFFLCFSLFLFLILFCFNRRDIQEDLLHLNLYLFLKEDMNIIMNIRNILLKNIMKIQLKNIIVIK